MVIHIGWTDTNCISLDSKASFMFTGVGTLTAYSDNECKTAVIVVESEAGCVDQDITKAQSVKATNCPLQS